MSYGYYILYFIDYIRIYLQKMKVKSLQKAYYLLPSYYSVFAPETSDSSQFRRWMLDQKNKRHTLKNKQWGRYNFT